MNARVIYGSSLVRDAVLAVLVLISKTETGGNVEQRIAEGMATSQVAFAYHGHRKPCQEILDPNKCIRLALDCIDVLALVSEHSSGFSKLHSIFFSAGMAENNFLASSSISCKQ